MTQMTTEQRRYLEWVKALIRPMTKAQLAAIARFIAKIQEENRTL